MITDLTKAAIAWQKLKRSLKSSSHGQEIAPTEIVIGNTREGLPVYWPQLRLESSSHIVNLASSGSGKSVLIGNALVRESLKNMEDPSNRPAILVIDPKSDLVKIVLQGRAALAQDNTEIVYLNPFQNGFGFNLNRLNRGQTPLDIRAMGMAGLVSSVSTSWGAQKQLGTGARQFDLLQALLLGALDSPDPRASVCWTLDALQEKHGLRNLAEKTRSERARAFLLNTELNDELRASTASRLRLAFATSDALEGIVTAESCLQFSDLLAPGKVVLLDLGEPSGGLLCLQEFWANLFLRLTVEFLMERPSPWNGHMVRVVIDEAHLVAPVLSDVAERLLTTGRSRGISLVALSQGTVLLRAASDTLLQVLLTNTPNKLIGRLSAQDSELLGKEIAPKPGIDEKIKEIRQRFSTKVCNLPDRQFYFLSPGQRQLFYSSPVDLEAWKMAAQDKAQELQEIKTKYALKQQNRQRVRLSETIQARTDRTRKTSSYAAKTRWG